MLTHLLCRLFGHRPEFGWCHQEGRGYFKVQLGPVDGIGRMHASLYCKCERCGIEYKVGMIHIPHVDEISRSDFYKEWRGYDKR